MTHKIRTSAAIGIVMLGAYVISPLISDFRAKGPGLLRPSELEDFITPKIEVVNSALSAHTVVLPYATPHSKCTGFISCNGETRYIYSNGIVTNSLILDADNSLFYKRK